MTEEIKQETVPDQAGQTKETPVEKKEPVKSDSGQQDELPETYRGKTVADLAKMHQELEKKLGAHSQELGATRKEIEQWRVLGSLIKNNPTLAKAIEAEIDLIDGKKTTTQEQPSVRDDVRISAEQNIIEKFESKYGLAHLPAEKRQVLNKKIGEALAEMVDPSGTKSLPEILNSISLVRLPKFLDNAYKLVAGDDREERARMEAYVTARQNSEATFSSFPSSQSRSDSITLTPAQKAAAKGMGMTEEDYIKELRAINKGE